ncbi:MAG: WG repeat-containing protein [Oscillospiraceae bacterium]
MGPIGILCGSFGSGKKNTSEFWICNNCGSRFQDKEIKKYNQSLNNNEVTVESVTFQATEPPVTVVAPLPPKEENAVKAVKPHSPKTVVERPSPYTGNLPADALLKRALIFLEDGDWEKAYEYSENALDVDAGYAEAYLAKFMAEYNIFPEDSIPDKCADMMSDIKSLSDFESYRKAQRFGDDEFKQKLENYSNQAIYFLAEKIISKADSPKKYIEAVTLFKRIPDYSDSKSKADEYENKYCNLIYDDAVKLKLSAKDENDYARAKSEFEKIISFKDAIAQVEECSKLSETYRNDRIYANALEKQQYNTIYDLEAAIANYKKIPGWKDADEQLEKCQKRITEIEEKKKSEHIEIQKNEEIIQAKKKTITGIIIVFIIVIICMLIIIIGRFPNPQVQNTVASSDVNNSQNTETYHATDEQASPQIEEIPSQMTDGQISNSSDTLKLAAVSLNGSWGYIDESGSFVIEPQFDEAYNFASNGLAVVRISDKWGYIDTNGNLAIEPQFDDEYVFTDNNLALVEMDNKWGYINDTGSFIIDPQFDYARNFANGLAVVEKNDKHYYINENGDIVIEIKSQWDEFDDFTNNGLAVVRTNNTWKYGFIDITGSFVIKPQFDFVYDFANNGLAAVDMNGKFGYINETGSIVIEPQFDWSYGFADDGLALIELNGKSGYINETGSIIIEPQFDYARNFANDGLAVVAIDDKFGYINETGSIVIEPQFDKALDFENGLAVISLNDKWGYVDTHGHLAIEPQFDNASSFKHISNQFN